MKYLVNRETKEHRILNEEVGGVTLVHTSVKLWDIVEADPEGWIKYYGRDCPLPGHFMVETKGLRGEFLPESKASNRDWLYVAYYRPILNDKPMHTKEGDTVTAHDCHSFTIELPQHDLIDRLRASHKAASELPDIIAELREVLGPDLMEMLVAKSKFTDKVKRYHEDFSILAAQIKDPQAEPEDDEHGWCGDEPEPDMTDWRNWREGDKMEVTKTDKNDKRNGLMTGDIVTLTQGNNNIPYCRTESGDIWAFGSKSLRFHSRPTKEQDK